MAEWPRPAAEYCQQAEVLIQRGDPVRALGQLTIALEADAGHRPAYRLLRQALEKLSAHGDVASFAAVLDHFDDPKVFYKAGCRAMDLGRFRWASALFRRADMLAPAEPGILIELAVAYAHTNRLAEAVAVLERIEDLDRHFWGLYELAWCTLCLQCLAEARPLVERLPDRADDERQISALPKLRHFLMRLERYGPLENPTVRQWVAMQFGGAVLEIDPELQRAGGRFGLVRHDLDTVAEVLARLAVLVEKRDLVPRRIRSGESAYSAILAGALATHWEVPTVSLAESPPDRQELIVAAAAEETYQVEGLVRSRPQQALFVYDARWNIDGYTCPDVAGIYSLRCEFPWADGSESAEALAERLAGRLLAAVDGAAADPGLAYLLEIGEHLVLGNWDRYPHRPSFSSEVPLPTPTMM